MLTPIRAIFVACVLGIQASTSSAQDAPVDWQSRSSDGLIQLLPTSEDPDLFKVVHDRFAQPRPGVMGGVMYMRAHGVDDEQWHRLVVALGEALLKVESTEVRQSILFLDDISVVRVEAVAALGRIGADSETVVPVLIDVLDTDDTSFVRSEAAMALSAFPEHSSKTVPELIKALSTLEYPTWAARSLGNLGPRAKEALPALRALREQTHSHWREFVDEAIRSIEEGEFPVG